jgi:hypothetical protein
LLTDHGANADSAPDSVKKRKYCFSQGLLVAFHCVRILHSRGACHEKACGQEDLNGHRKEQVSRRGYLEPRQILESEGAIITVASSSRDIAIGMLGLKVKPDVLLTDVKETYFDGIVFIGGGGAAEYFDNPVAHKLAQSFFEQGKLTSAICIAPTTLANTGVLKGKKATAFPSSVAALSSQRSDRHEAGCGVRRNDRNRGGSSGGKEVRPGTGKGARGKVIIVDDELDQMNEKTFPEAQPAGGERSPLP